jgi:hypothetical protein
VGLRSEPAPPGLGPLAISLTSGDLRFALKGIDTALKALEMFAKLSGQLQGPQHNHLHLQACAGLGHTRIAPESVSMAIDTALEQRAG